MSTRYLLLLFLHFFLWTGIKAQSLSIDNLIKAWNRSDVTQTEAYANANEDLAQHPNQQAFSLKMDSLHKYFKHHNNPRAWIRSVMYEIQGSRQLKIPFRTGFITKIERAIILAGLEHDQQLVSELYFLYSDKYLNPDAESRLFYRLKAIDIQRQIGFDHFPQIYLSFLAISRSMYRTVNYRQSINYARQCLKLMKSPATNMYCYILVLDQMGASYKKLGMADSTNYCYQQISLILNNKAYDKYTHKNSDFAPIWRGVVAGGMAQALFLKKQYSQAYPLLLQNLSSSNTYKQWNDAALAAITIAKINYIEHNYDSAMHYFKMAYRWRSVYDDLPNLIAASKGIADVYLHSNRFDSAYRFMEHYHVYKDSLLVQMNKCNLSTLQAQVAYDHLEHSLNNAQATIDKQRRLKNTMLACLAVLGIIALLLYNRYRLKQHYLLQLRERNNKAVKAEMIHAKAQIARFTSNIKEKDAIIAQLNHQSPKNEQQINAINERLRHYTLITEEEWVKFKGEFVKAYPNFYARLYKVLHKMTASEERLTALMYLRLSNGEISGTLGISKESVSRSKHRLTQRIDLPKDVSLENYLLSENDV